MPGGTRGFELLIPFVIGGLILHGFIWLVAVVLPFDYVGLFSDVGLVVWIGGGCLCALLYLIATDGWRETIVPIFKWAIAVAIIYAVVGSVIWYFNTYQDSPLVSWLADAGKAMVTGFEGLPGAVKMVILIFGFIAFFTLLPMSCYYGWQAIKVIFRKLVKLVRPTEPKPPGRASS